MLKVIGLIILLGAIFIGVFVQYGKKQMKDFNIDFSQTMGKIMIVTGANSGLGYYTTMALVKAGSEVIMACRTVAKCEEAKKTILQEFPTGKLSCMELDLTSFTSIRNFADSFTQKYDHLDVLINNAGIMAPPTREVTQDGLESQIGTNHFAFSINWASLSSDGSQWSNN